jgi:hypothetical protein
MGAERKMEITWNCNCRTQDKTKSLGDARKKI